MGIIRLGEEMMRVKSNLAETKEVSMVTENISHPMKVFELN